MSIGCLAITGAILTVVSIIGLMVEQNIDSRIMVICFCSGSTTNGNTLTVLLLDELRINRRNKESIHSNSPSVLSLTVVFTLNCLLVYPGLGLAGVTADETGMDGKFGFLYCELHAQ
ncbi:hypothetical protein TWF594_011102 [Orbilia oligospora]|nr:hypothetical protein TWF706_011058 [Orbilia oligospora]KAF3091209.1 hypothetical protein TWF103_011700 [Orbilia oligospora]KAF3129256.1 hypothetical protein TWF594_011102 [Orbilia oligospora]